MLWKQCPVCKESFETVNENKQYCSNKCKTAAFRKRRKDKTTIKVKDVYKTCPECKTSFPLKSGNQKYCSVKCRQKHNLDKKREYDQKRYLKFGWEKKIRMKGTISIGQHKRTVATSTYLGADIPNTEFRKERSIIRKELKRTLSGRRGNQRWMDKLAESVPEKKVSLNHGYVTNDEVANENTKLILNLNMKRCPECQGTKIEKDKKHSEIVCTTCGLILMGVPDSRVKYPYQEKYHPLGEIFSRECPKPPKPKYKSPDNTWVKVLCKRCFKPYNMPYKCKETFYCECGGRMMGIGICGAHEREIKVNGYIPNGYDLRPTEERHIGE